MKEIVKKMSTHIILQAVVSMILGLLLVIWPNVVTKTFIYLAAAFVALLGLIAVLSYARSKNKPRFFKGDLIAGVFGLIVALIMFIFPAQIMGFFGVILGAFIAFNGTLNVFRALEIKKSGEQQWMLVLILNLVVGIGGIAIVFNPKLSIILLGVIVLAKGVIDLFTGLIFINAAKKLAKEIDKEISKEIGNN